MFMAAWYTFLTPIALFALRNLAFDAPPPHRAMPDQP